MSGSVWYDYNSLGQKKEVTIKDGVGATVHPTTYDYYRNGWLKSINYDGNKVAEYTHDAVGLLAQIDFYHDDPVLGNIATGAYDVYSYDTTDPSNFLKTITMHYKDAVGNPASSVVDYTDAYGNPNVDKAGNQLSMGNLAGQWTYTYDHAGRIASIVPPNPVPEQGLGGDYGYNWLGQLTNPPADPNHLTYNSAGLLSTWPGMYSYTYKANGWPFEVRNPSGTMVIAALTYDPAAYPSECGLSGVTAEFSWDADGAFVGYTETGGGSECETMLSDPTAPDSCVLVDNTSGNPLYYISDPEGQVVASVSSAGQADYHSDADGQFQASTANDGRAQYSYTYGPDGELVPTTDPQGGNTVSGAIGVPGERATSVPRFVLLDWVDDASDFFAGWGDTLTFGATGRIRMWLGVNDVVDEGSGWYLGGQITGMAHSIAFGAAAGARAAGTRGAGREFSHFWPKRWGGPRNIFNGNYVAPARHYLHDVFRYPRGWRDLGTRLPPVIAQLDRIPNLYKGIAAGSAYGVLGKAASDRENGKTIDGPCPCP